MKSPKRPCDVAQLAKFIVEIASGERPNERPQSNEAAVRRGVARAESLTPRKRKAIAKKAANARWKKG